MSRSTDEEFGWSGSRQGTLISHVLRAGKWTQGNRNPRHRVGRPNLANSFRFRPLRRNHEEIIPFSLSLRGPASRLNVVREPTLGGASQLEDIDHLQKLSTTLPLTKCGRPQE